jgi:hypothetical protein
MIFSCRERGSFDATSNNFRILRTGPVARFFRPGALPRERLRRLDVRRGALFNDYERQFSGGSGIG